MRNTNKMHAGRQMTQVAAKNSEGTLPGGNTVLVELDGGIAWVSMHRPDKRNCISPTLASEMLAVLNALEADKRCQIVVLTGSGDSFSAGMDLKEFFRDNDHLSPPERAHIYRTNITLRATDPESNPLNFHVL